MNNKFNYIIFLVFLVFNLICIPVSADGNSLMQMDVKKSSVSDTVDVTFYTTSDSANSVVTRKSNNKYVVLLPNTASADSIAPSLGGVRDLITDVDVKSVNDGMGGYTKVTFGTTKPINIKTHMTKTSPLSQAQKDSRAILAKNNTIVPKSQPATSTATVAKPVTAPAKQVATVQQPTKPTVAQKSTSSASTVAKVASLIPTQAKKNDSTTKPVSNNLAQAKPTQPKQNVVAKPKTSAVTNKVTTPVVKESQVPKTSSQPAVVDTAKEQPVVEQVEDIKPVDEVQEEVVETLPEEDVGSEPVNQIVEDSEDVNESIFSAFFARTENLPAFALFVGLLIIAVGIFLSNRFSSQNQRNEAARRASFAQLSSRNLAQRRKRSSSEIANNEELGWQEKYQKFNDLEDSIANKKHVAAMSSVVDKSNLAGGPVILAEGESTPFIANERIKAKILELENRSKAVEEFEIMEDEIKPEENVALTNFSTVKLRGFAKTVSGIGSHNKTLIEDDKLMSKNRMYKENRLAKTSNSIDSITPMDLVNTGNKYLTDVNKVNKSEHKYAMASLEEYCSIFDTDSNSDSKDVKVNTATSVPMTRSGVSNPIERAKHLANKSQASQSDSMIDNYVITSGYSIDSNKGFYLVNVDGVSAIIGMNNGTVYEIKKFDSVISGKLQVRKDSANVYIVKVGRYKSLVEVSEEKIGVLIEI